MFKSKKLNTILASSHPLNKGFYAWNSLYAGSFLLFIESKKDYYSFMLLPGPEEMNLTKETFDKCIQNNVLEFVESLPEDIYQETLTQFKYKKDLDQSKKISDHCTDEY